MLYNKTFAHYRLVWDYDEGETDIEVLDCRTLEEAKAAYEKAVDDCVSDLPFDDEIEADLRRGGSPSDWGGAVVKLQGTDVDEDDWDEDDWDDDYWETIDEADAELILADRIYNRLDGEDAWDEEYTEGPEDDELVIKDNDDGSWSWWWESSEGTGEVYYTDRHGEGIFRQGKDWIERRQLVGCCQFQLGGLSDSRARYEIRRWMGFSSPDMY